MTTEEKTNREGRRETDFRFPFGDPQAIKEMMKAWCSPGMGFCCCCSMATVTEDEPS